MTTEIIVGLIIAGVVGWTALLVTIIKWLLAQYSARLNETIEEMNLQISGAKEKAHELDKKILELRVELQDKFVRRDDAIREQVLINAKLDALAAKIDMRNMRGDQ